MAPNKGRGAKWNLMGLRQTGFPRRVCEALLSVLLVIMFWASPALGQVAFIAASAPKTAQLTLLANTISFSQTLSSQSNGLLIIGVSLNINQSATSAVTQITDNGTPLTEKIGTANDTGNRVRIELWALKAPPVGTNNIVVTVSVLTGTVGATTVSRS